MVIGESQAQACINIMREEEENEDSGPGEKSLFVAEEVEELVRHPEGSWSCSGCHRLNDASCLICLDCSLPTGRFVEKDNQGTMKTDSPECAVKSICKDFTYPDRHQTSLTEKLGTNTQENDAERLHYTIEEKALFVADEGLDCLSKLASMQNQPHKLNVNSIPLNQMRALVLTFGPEKNEVRRTRKPITETSLRRRFARWFPKFVRRPCQRHIRTEIGR
jgi:hypothetical protein